MPFDFYLDYEMFWVRLYHMASHVPPTVLCNDKFPISCFISFILYWSCLFLCNMPAGLFTWLQNLTYYLTQATYSST
jgi:hypothetical protein